MVCIRRCSATMSRYVRAAQGNFELNVFKPVIADAMLQSIAPAGRRARELRGALRRSGIEQRATDRRYARALADAGHRAGARTSATTPPRRIAKEAHRNGTTLRHEALRLGLVDAETFDRVVDARKMIIPRARPH